jgi:hypothetical protein
MGSCLGGRRRIRVLLWKISEAIVRRARGGDQRGQFGEGFDRYEDGAEGQCGAGHSVGHPHRNGSDVLILLAQPHVTTVAHAPLHENRLAMQRMPRVMNDDVLSAVGRI